jgi:mRNA-degrading endonuclease RelE of RelBE toxin-antitoxin system
MNRPLEVRVDLFCPLIVSVALRLGSGRCSPRNYTSGDHSYAGPAKRAVTSATVRHASALETKSPSRRERKASIPAWTAGTPNGRILARKSKGLRSWRNGDYPIAYRIVETRLEVLGVALGHHREVYDRLGRRL